MIDFLRNDIYGATYTYELGAIGSFRDLFERENTGDGAPQTQFRIVDGKAYMTVARKVPIGEGTVVFGCNSAPKNSKLVTIQRERLPREDQE